VSRLTVPALAGLCVMFATAITVIGCELRGGHSIAVVEKKKPAPECSEVYLACSVMSARIRNRLVQLPGCSFHPIFTALYSFHCAFFAGEPSKAQQLQCTEAMSGFDCPADGMVMLDDLPLACTTALGLPTDIRW
jgi:hypothetical protein